MKKVRNIAKAFVIVVLYAVIFAVITASCGEKSDSSVIVAGSTSVQPYVEMLAAGYY
ncbi:MAG: hypothetical protein FWH10_04650 [Oscillospiraceae bacterium]|nr:hypothetical protein [Oscillospiraceae bacterium]